MGNVKSFKEFINEKTELPEISDENKELLRQFFDFLLKANKRPKAKYHLAINTNNDPVWNGEIDERHRHIWDNFVDQLKQLTGIIPMRVIEEVVDKDGNCIDPNFRNILVDLDEDYIAEFDEDELTFRIPAESFIDEDGAKFIQDELLEVTEEGYEPKHTYEEDDFPFDNYPYEEGKIKKFSKFVNEEFIHEDEDDRKHLIDIVKRTVRSERTAEILLSYFGLYKDENGEYLNPKTIDELAYRYGLSDSQIKNILNKGITKLKQAFVDKHDKSYTSMPKRGLRRQLWLRDQIMDKDREYIYDLLNAMNNREEISDEDIEDMRSVDANDMGSIKNDLYYEEMTELKSILAKIDKGSIEDYEEESYGVFVNIKTDSRYKVFLDDQKDEAEDFVANNEDVLSDVMDYPYKYKGYEKHFYIVMLDSKE